MSIINFSSVTGLNVAAYIYQNNIQVGDPIPLAESPIEGEYSGNVPASLDAGSYLVVFREETLNAKLASGILNWDGIEEMDSTWMSKKLEGIFSSAEATRVDLEKIKGPTFNQTTDNLGKVSESVRHVETVLDGFLGV